MCGGLEWKIVSLLSPTKATGQRKTCLLWSLTGVTCLTGVWLCQKEFLLISHLWLLIYVLPQVLTFLQCLLTFRILVGFLCCYIHDLLVHDLLASPFIRGRNGTTVFQVEIEIYVIIFKKNFTFNLAKLFPWTLPQQHCVCVLYVYAHGQRQI